jgi:hypothetical protein
MMPPGTSTQTRSFNYDTGTSDLPQNIFFRAYGTLINFDPWGTGESASHAGRALRTPCPTPPSPLKPGSELKRNIVCSDERILGAGH